MARKRKPHPAEIANANIVAEAVRFDIALFLGVGRYATDTAKTMEEALAKADRLVALHPNGRRPLIYGVTADGRSGLVTNATLSNTEDSMKKVKKKSMAKRVGKPAATKKTQKSTAKQDGTSTRRLGKRAAIKVAARKGKLPEPPDFSAETHKRFRKKLATVVELAEAGDLKGLRSFQINPVSSSPKAIARYRDLCIVALEARRG
jgi:hypothetical protein